MIRRFLVTLLVSALASIGAVATIAPGRAVRSCATPPTYHPGALGAVAYMHDHTVRVVDLSSGRDRALATLPRQQNSRPPIVWSTGGRWIAVGGTLVSAATGATCRLFGADASSVEPRPHSEAWIANTAAGRVMIAGPGQVGRPLLPAGFSVAGSAFDRSGRRLVAEEANGSLWVFELGTGKRVRVWRSPSPLGRVGPALGERWSSDGRWILFQTDPFRSASIAADGLPLWAVPATGGRPIEVEHRLLTAADFVQPCGRSGRMVISAGFDRYVSAHKRIDLAKPPRWRAQSISHETRHSWYAAACSPDGRLVAATVTGNRDEGRFDTAKRSIWLLTSDGSSRKLLVRSGAGISVEQPRWSRDGRWILYLQHRARPNPVAALYLRNVESGQRRGPFGRIKGGLGYYGYHDWDDEAAWYRGP